MKKLLTSVTAASVLGMGIFFGGLTAHAEEEGIVPAPQLDLTTPGYITFTPDDGPITVLPPGEDGPNVTIPTLPGEDLNTGPLTIAYAPTLNFGSHVIDISTIEKRYPIIAEMQLLDNDSEKEVPYISFVQVQDRRGTNDGWNLHVNATNFIAALNEDNNSSYNTLTGAQIQFSNSRLQYSGDSKHAPIFMEQITLAAGGDSLRIMNADNGDGAGISSLMWGNQADLTNGTHTNDAGDVLNSAIELVIPGTTLLNAATYNATLNWQLVAGHANELPPQ